MKLCVLTMLVFVMIVPTHAQPAPTPFIIDTDMAADDWMAILYLLQRSDIALQAISVTGTGEAHCEPGIQHAMDLLALAGNPDIPVACGRETPLAGDHSFPQAWRDDVDALSGLSMPANSNPPYDGTAVELLTDVLQNAEEKIAILTLGPLTNLAEAFEAEPPLIDKIEMIYIMGGAVDVPGNVGFSGVEIDNTVAEWNLYADPRAAAMVFESGAPITLVPLDVTNLAPLTMDFYQQVEQNHTTPEAEFVYQLLTQKQGFIDSGYYFFWDPLAADNSLATFEPRQLVVVEDEGQESGRTAEDESGAEIRVAVTADNERFESTFLSVLNGESAGL